MIIDAILPAAGRIDGSFAAEAGVKTKALISLDGHTVLERAISVLRATGRIGKIVVIGTDEVIDSTAAKAADAVLPEAGPTGPDNIFAGLQWVYEANNQHHPDKVLLLTTDLPFIIPETITDFLDICPDDLDICLPVIRRTEFENRFPGLTIEYVRLRDGEWTMGCAFLLNPTAIARNRSLLDSVFAARKSQIAMARLLGLPFILRYFSKRLTIPQIEQRCLGLLGCSGRGIQQAAPELAMDIDSIADYYYARDYSISRQ
jgi:CTP:molybdopterin cytidylyltransferase MocA